MFKIEKPSMDLFLWEKINQKYWMKYKVNYSKLEEEFINDLIKYKVLKISFNNEEYQSYKDILNDKRLNDGDISFLRIAGKYIFDKEVDDNSYIGELKSKILIY